jgi:hypothetical protein
MWWPLILKIYYVCLRWWFTEGYDRRKDRDERYDKNKYD